MYVDCDNISGIDSYIDVYRFKIDMDLKSIRCIKSRYSLNLSDISNSNHFLRCTFWCIVAPDFFQSYF